MVENNRAKLLIIALLNDLQQDTAQLSMLIEGREEKLLILDSLNVLLQKPLETIDRNSFYRFVAQSSSYFKFSQSTGTISQLKNSGNMRLIRNTDVFQKISLYWNEQENTRISLSRYLEYRNRGREYSEKLFAFSDQDLINAKLIAPSGKGVRVIQSNPALWSEYSNIVSHCHITVLNYLDQLEKLLEKAEELIGLLQKEYHLK